MHPRLDAHLTHEDFIGSAYPAAVVAGSILREHLKTACSVMRNLFALQGLAARPDRELADS